jgi:hypothetical protein
MQYLMEELAGSREKVMTGRSWVLLSRALFLCFGLVICITFPDYGFTYDEEGGQSQELGDRSLSKN